jgi:hypothetical protein
MLHEAFGEYSSSWTAVFECHSLSRPVKCQLKIIYVQGDQAPAKQQKMLKKFKKSSTKNITKQSMSSQKLLG